MGEQLKTGGTPEWRESFMRLAEQERCDHIVGEYVWSEAGRGMEETVHSRIVRKSSGQCPSADSTFRFCPDCGKKL